MERREWQAHSVFTKINLIEVVEFHQSRLHVARTGSFWVPTVSIGEVKMGGTIEGDW